MKKLALLLTLITATTVAQTDSLKTEDFEDVLHLREIPRHNLIVDFGIVQPIGDYGDVARSGLNIGGEYLYYRNKCLGIGVTLRHQYNEFGYLDFQNDENTLVTNNNWTNTSIAIGPTYSYTKNRFQLDVFAKAGVAFIKNPENSVLDFQIQDGPSREFFIADDANSSSTSAYIETGLRFNYYFRRSVQVFFSPQFSTTLGNPLAYRTLESNSQNNFESRANVLNEINVSNLIFNVGIKIAIGKEYSNGELRVDD